MSRIVKGRNYTLYFSPPCTQQGSDTNCYPRTERVYPGSYNVLKDIVHIHSIIKVWISLLLPIIMLPNILTLLKMMMLEFPFDINDWWILVVIILIFFRKYMIVEAKRDIYVTFTKFWEQNVLQNILFRASNDF